MIALVLRHTNDKAKAEELLSSALEAVDDPDVRAAVSRRLTAD
jgi:hypothetical protein